ncbi:3'(2'),5'-bisphosphate nucleotidase CysQ [Aliikangiella sp. IMCC44359]|uniref:3'(2'),5'-bisphosphate nucleotidase CysQ n=1 Tax=Aliikangiella sp. IMCC44359 TaxID=3459125 RepID=UPI00403ABEF9
MNVAQYPLNEIMQELIITAKKAGNAIMDVYNSDDFNVQIKGDDSPLTRADLAAHHIIIERLQARFPDIPCLSEESTDLTFAERKSWQQCFIIDPLDGTKEFIARNDDFTVNIALVTNHKPVAGVIYAPVLDTVYYAAENEGAFKQVKDEAPTKISVRKLQKKNGQNHFTVVASRRHGLEKVETLCQNFSSYDLTSRGSSLKMCLVAEGKADLYPRLAPTSEWDTAAAQAIVEQAGGQLLQLDFSEMAYNQKESLLNPFFLVLGDPEFDWKASLVVS